jgi:hypothetical protein
VETVEEARTVGSKVADGGNTADPVLGTKDHRILRCHQGNRSVRELSEHRRALGHVNRLEGSGCWGFTVKGEGRGEKGNHGLCLRKGIRVRRRTASNTTTLAHNGQKRKSREG